MQKKCAVSIIFFLGFLAGSAQATVLIQDNYYGGDEFVNPVNGAISIAPAVSDVIGSETDFGVSQMEVQIGTQGGLASDRAKVTIQSTFFDNAFGTTDSSGATYELGDLFISTDDWSPFGAANYLSDVASNGEDWEYAVVLDDHAATSGDLFLFAVNEADIIFSDSQHSAIAPSGGFHTAGSAYGQEVQYNANLLGASSVGTWSISGDFLTFDFGIAGMTGLSEDDFAMRWTMTCGNDIIEGGSPVPEPATMLLFGAGLIGLIGRGITQRTKKS